jgi:hypothetical protein
VKNVQKVLDGKTGACQNGLTDRRNSDGQASKCFKSSKKALDRQKQVCETGFTEQNATTGSKSSKKVLDSRNEACKTGSTEQTNPGTARRASLKEHYHDCNHQKRPG